jgi:hypothetical protein
MRRGDVIWNGNEWRQAWKIALMRINGAPRSVSEQIAFRHAIDMLDSAFVKGMRLSFSLDLSRSWIVAAMQLNKASAQSGE